MAGSGSVFLLRAGYKPKNSRIRPDKLRQEFELVKLLGKLATKLWAHINCKLDHDKSGKKHSDKHGRNDGLTGSRSQLRGGEQSSLAVVVSSI